MLETTKNHTSMKSPRLQNDEVDDLEVSNKQTIKGCRDNDLNNWNEGGNEQRGNVGIYGRGDMRKDGINTKVGLGSATKTWRIRLLFFAFSKGSKT